ncbi:MULTISPECIES: helix-turn-helix domain-containing GNAT family N-acetyltransferase [unclassified Bosea (in: a-proteobacteria)]|uniref:bifunctional helix-turn-helix transcriptional regulator/GNAT family N-acetyltransferase n=1 Tax=unclassified Bosea (in: a-proteobacteria) TaxID=2653178 RepID=UPI000F761F7E|nr:MULTISPECIES: helix-turn-helix domain-containing GNAT family N-acetyltransferase [unclassified Bosea (in: a-proteobacteria)]AZO76646.1 MarR family transcriptional regulator [Bosea sp. Tri-49]RXT21477.1 MarR family transcriptional regulator [Bosea sp. Tri-39]RXT31816.1 MarR family transcriptional regulator [Bosea sp. Tri-54]
MSAVDTSAIATIRRFGRFHTRFIGALGGDLHGSGFGLTEGRVLYELAQRDGWRAGELARELGLDPAYLSRLLKRFIDLGWLERTKSDGDGRAYELRLTTAGRMAFVPLDDASRRQADMILSRLATSEQASLVTALDRAQALLSGAASPQPAVTIREHRPGDIGWVISAHGRLYAEVYGWDISFEALVAEIAVKFLREFRPGHERCFIAELDGAPVGSAFVVRESDEVAKLRLVLVETRAQGLGLGKRLVREALSFARAAGYRSMALWTNDILHAARAIYIAEGFRLVAEEKHHSFGKDLVGQNWERDL